MDKFEKMISFVFNSEEISPDDKLSREIQAVKDDELALDDLDFVAAATGTTSFDKFKSMYIDKK